MILMKYEGCCRVTGGKNEKETERLVLPAMMAAMMMTARMTGSAFAAEDGTRLNVAMFMWIDGLGSGKKGATAGPPCAAVSERRC